MTKLLIIDGYDTAGIEMLKSVGATLAGTLYKRMLADYAPEAEIDIAEISHAEPIDIDIKQYEGVCWTGSNLFFSATDKIVQRHIDLCQSLFKSGIPQFGSCWAAQLAAKASGGDVDQNPKGREFGIARKIGLTQAGKEHPMYKGKSHIFDGFTSHGDIVTSLPTGATLLASNSFSPIQALEVKHENGEFWAVQYHPEYDFSEVAGLADARQDALIDQGTFHDRDAALSYIQDMKTLNNDASRSDLAWKLGVDEDLQDKSIRTLEVKNWLSHYFGV